ITSPRIKHPFSLVIHNDQLFVTDWRIDAILAMNKRDGSQERVLRAIEEGNRLYGIRVFSQKSQPTELGNPCSAQNQNGGCEKFCFTVPINSSAAASAGAVGSYT